MKIEIQIDKNIQIPAGNPKGRKQKYPFPDMEVGDSFELFNVPKNTVLNAAKSWALRHKKDWTFTIRTFKEKESVRIWRIK